MARLTSGIQLGPYEILSLLGAGGMGEVYKARDSRLNRFVAIKVLPDDIAARSEAKQRFEREAQAIAALNDPHICVLHDIGHHEGIGFLVMEYLEGQTMAERLAQGALPVPDALDYAAQILDALDKAHRAGVTHRDLKPGNIMLTKSGIKLLDFGLARLKQPNPTPAFTSNSALPTGASPLTQEGSILGTLQYMAPEQLEGKEADSRTDIFAFGSVLFEMLSGRKAFEGKTQVGLMGAILEREPPPVSQLQPSIPPALDRVLLRCLSKNPDERWQTAADLKTELAWVLQTPVSTSQPHSRNYWKAASAVLLVGMMAFAAATMYLYRRESTRDIVRFSVTLPPNTTFGQAFGSSNIVGPAVSPDGRKIAFTARDAAGKFQLWVQAIDSLSARFISGTEDLARPFWSPDGRSIAFFQGDKLRRVDLDGGRVLTICDQKGFTGGGAWNSEDVILFGSATTVFKVAATGGEPVPVTKLTNQQSHRWPSFLPDGRHFIYYANGSGEDSGIFLGDLTSGETKRLLAADTAASYVSPGYLLFVRQGILLVQEFDGLKLIGEAKPIAEQVGFEPGFPAAFSASNTGVIAYRTGVSAAGENRLTWVDRNGRELGQAGPPGSYRGLDLSPDGKKLAVHQHEYGGGDVWVIEAERPTPSRLTFDASQENWFPVVSPDGKRVAFASTRAGTTGIYEKSSDGAGSETLLFESDTEVYPLSWSPDNRYLVFGRVDGRTRDLWLLPLEGEKKPQRFVNGALAQVSPDGKWIAYAGSDGGRARQEIFVRPFPTGSSVWQISTNGGFEMRWRPDGREMFYTSGGKMMAVDVKTGGSVFEWGAAKGLFDLPVTVRGHAVYEQFAVSPDGQRFLIHQLAGASSASVIDSFTVVLNWPSLLQKNHE
jgi:serine/threonine protein kinase